MLHRWDVTSRTWKTFYIAYHSGPDVWREFHFDNLQCIMYWSGSCLFSLVGRINSYQKRQTTLEQVSHRQCIFTEIQQISWGVSLTGDLSVPPPQRWWHTVSCETVVAFHWQQRRWLNSRWHMSQKGWQCHTRWETVAWQCAVKPLLHFRNPTVGSLISKTVWSSAALFYCPCS